MDRIYRIRTATFIKFQMRRVPHLLHAFRGDLSADFREAVKLMERQTIKLKKQILSD
jgi:hypothetical protein